MKIINYLNYFFVGVPTILFLIGILKDSFLFFGLLSVIMTGLFQVTIGIKMLIDKPNDKFLMAYIIGVLTFFILWFICLITDYENPMFYILISTPPILAIYLSIIIYKKANK
ncbi:hypothetical protein [Flavobacterium commune]|uniref:Uncharacterized protein n=1 Tax=Flavobacterium commune TaxID=1306519 RepID=A0A1D9P7Q5_9FLAO|nr:hypothetical protein [Flavobacterium commune]AOZ98618.1 hypothetical protein BIW12_03735 [Flavobacterium commune]